MKSNVTPAIPFTPSSAQMPVDLKAHAFGVRKNMLFKAEGEDQYLVFAEGYDATTDPDAKHIIGSGFSLSHAIVSARMSQALKQIKPSLYSSRLEGCRFIEVVEAGNSALQHVVVDSQGRELGRADMREKAAKLSLHRALVGVKDITFEEFSQIAVPCHVEPAGRRSHGAVFYDDRAQNGFAALVSAMYKACPDVRTGAESIRAAASGYAAEDAVRALRERCNKEALSSLGSSAGVTFRLSAEDGAWQAFAVLHTSQISAATAMRIAYEGYVEELAEWQASKIEDMPHFSG